MYVLRGDIKSIIDPLNYYYVEYYDVIHLLSISFAIFGHLNIVDDVLKFINLSTDRDPTR
jgi:hypothetical protein